MKLNKLTSAVSVSLLAVALTACGGSDDDAPIINNNASTTPAPAPTPTPAPTPAVVDNTANIAALTAAFKAAGLSDAKAAELAAANPTITAGGAEFNALVTAAKAPANTGTNNAVSEVVDRQNPFIKGVNTQDKATVSANQYIRQDGSTYERSANPAQSAGLGAIATDDPTAQNPYLSNYVLGVEVSSDRKIIAIDSTGELVKADGSALVAAAESPYATRDGYIYTTDATDSNRTYQYSSDLEIVSGTGVAGDPEIKNYKKDVKHNASDAFLTAATARTNYIGKVVTIQDINQATTLVSPDAAVAAEAAAGVTGRTAPATFTPADHVKTGLLVYTKNSTVVGNAIGKAQGLKDAVFGVEENIYQTNKDGKLVAVNTPEKVAGAADDKVAFEIVPKSNNDAVNSATHKAPNTYTEQALTGTENGALTSNDFETRVFGKNYRSTEVGKEGTQSYANSYVGRYTTNGTLNRVATTSLHNTQYGRLTNNIDVLDNESSKKSNALVYRQFQQHGAANTVDTYFYRGTNHTSLSDMEALKARGGTYQYYGHALTYGIGPKVPAAAKNTTLPTAYGLTSSESTIGNFVEAKFDAASSKVSGNIYNFINENVADSKSKFVKQDLVSFAGDVYGNTATGTATKLGVNEQGTFTGSFFGKNAQELGGAISSITRAEGYGSPKWGAVFGATKGSSVENFNVIEQGN